MFCYRSSDGNKLSSLDKHLYQRIKTSKYSRGHVKTVWNECEFLRKMSHGKAAKDILANFGILSFSRVWFFTTFNGISICLLFLGVSIYIFFLDSIIIWYSTTVLSENKVTPFFVNIDIIVFIDKINGFIPIFCIKIAYFL